MVMNFRISRVDYDKHVVALRRTQIVFQNGQDLVVRDYGGSVHTLWSVARLREARLITLSPDLELVAFWVRNNERFYLEDCNAGRIWERRINTDKADALAIRFAPAGDLLACFDEFDGVYRVHIFSITKHYESTLESFGAAILHDEELRRFTCLGPAGLTGDKSQVLRVLDRRGTVREEISGAPVRRGALRARSPLSLVQFYQCRDQWPRRRTGRCALHRARGQWVNERR